MWPPISREVMRKNMKLQIFWITKCIAQGPYPEREDELLAEGITHIFNVGTEVSQKNPKFTQIVERPFPDLKRIPDDIALSCLDILHNMLLQPNSNVYVHCVAGWNRSPTILYLYFIACGIEPQNSKELIERATLDAVGGHPSLIDNELVALAKSHGQKNFLPLSRPQVIEPV